jgi:hypothetical protein
LFSTLRELLRAAEFELVDELRLMAASAWPNPRSVSPKPILVPHDSTSFSFPPYSRCPGAVENYVFS